MSVLAEMQITRTIGSPAGASGETGGPAEAEGKAK